MMGPPLLHLVVELLLAFCTSSLIVLGLLRLSGLTFPLVETLEVTFVCTVAIFAALRGAGYFWNTNNCGFMQRREGYGSENAPVAPEREKKFVEDLV
ncbi:hypothetical protein C8R45DRAFT_1027361 [Mycena sanguinolenta]|nr:hypothetical protein C8R45DRAFT_1027361 [Mycena sanguinolenta]